MQQLRLIGYESTENIIAQVLIYFPILCRHYISYYFTLNVKTLCLEKANLTSLLNRRLVWLLWLHERHLPTRKVIWKRISIYTNECYRCDLCTIMKDRILPSTLLKATMSIDSQLRYFDLNCHNMLIHSRDFSVSLRVSDVP